MSFDIKLQINNSEKNRVVKSITDIATYTGVLKEETSIIDPVIKIECDLADVKNANYLTVETFGRSYFVNNIRSIRNGLVEFTCHVDVLSSFADEIKSNKAITRRQEQRWNTYLNDGVFKVYQNPDVKVFPFPSGFTRQEYVLAIAGS